MARRAKALLLEAPAGRLVAGHSDYEAQNVRCEGGRLVAVYDGDSLVAESAYNARLHHAFGYGLSHGPGSFAEATRAVAYELPP